MLFRVLIVLVVIAVAFGGYSYVNKILQEKRAEEYKKYASVIAETSVAAEMYRNKEDSFLIVRDSILRKYNLTDDDLLAFAFKYEGKEFRWAEFWDYVVNISDSLIAHQESLLAHPADSLVDSVGRR